MSTGLPAVYFNKIKEWFTSNFVTSVNGNKGDVTVNVETLIPSGAIMWFNLSSAPDGWKVCDGTNGTPNLIGKYPLGASSNIGDEVAAGLPAFNGTVNIETFSQGEDIRHRLDDGARVAAGGDRGTQATMTDLPLSMNTSGVYGNSNTVTPPSIKLLPCQKI